MQKIFFSISVSMFLMAISLLEGAGRDDDDLRNRRGQNVQPVNVPRQQDNIQRQPVHVPRQQVNIPRQQDNVPRQPINVPRQQINVPRQGREGRDVQHLERTPSISPLRAQVRQEQTRRAQDQRAAPREEIKQFLRRSPAAVQGRPLTEHQQSVKGALPQQIRTNAQAAHRVRSQLSQIRPEFDRGFNRNFFDRHHYHPTYVVNIWNPVPWGAINGWLGWGWQYPAYYDDSGYPFPVENVPVEYSQEPLSPEGDWLPLGNFVAGRTVDQAGYSTMFVQLALNQSGEIAGSYYNASTNQVHPLDGLVDQASQQVVWQVSDIPDSPYMTTGLYNLTQDVTNVQVTFSDGTQQTWYLVRLNE